MSRVLFLILIIVFSLSASASIQGELTDEEMGRVERFYKSYHRLVSKKMIYEDIINFKLSLPEETAEKSDQTINEIYKSHKLQGQATKLVSSFGGFYSQDYNRFAEFLVNSYYKDGANRGAVQILIKTSQSVYFGAGAKRFEQKKKDSFVPHFTKGAAEYAWATALALTFVSGRGFFKPGLSSVKKTSPGSLKRLGMAVSKTRLGKGIGTAISPITYVLKGTKKALLCNGKKRTWLRNASVRLGRDVGALAALAGGTGLSYGGVSWLLYKKGAFEKIDTMAELDKNIFALSALRLSCQAADYKAWAKNIEVNSLSDSSTLIEINKRTQELNQMAEDFSVLVDLAPLYLLSTKLSSEIKFKDDIVSYQNLSFSCPHIMVKSGESLVVDLQTTRDRIKQALRSLIERINALKYGVALEQYGDILQEYGDSFLGYARYSSGFMSNIDEFLKGKADPEKLKETMRELEATDLAFTIDERFLANLDEVFNESMTADEIYDSLSAWSQQTLLGLDDETYYGFLWKLFSSNMSSDKKKVNLLIVAYALDLVWNELKSSEQGTFLPKHQHSPLVILSKFLGHAKFSGYQESDGGSK